MLTDDTVLGDQVTVVIVPASAETLDEANIYYINQDAFGNKEAILVNMGIKGTELAKGDYLVKLGGSNGVIKTAKFTVGDDGYILGDVDGVAGINVNDATTVAKHVAGTIVLEGNNLLAADVDGVKGINVNDATTIAKYVAGTITEFTPAPAE